MVDLDSKYGLYIVMEYFTYEFLYYHRHWLILKGGNSSLAMNVRHTIHFVLSVKCAHKT